MPDIWIAEKTPVLTEKIKNADKSININQKKDRYHLLIADNRVFSFPEKACFDCIIAADQKHLRGAKIHADQLITCGMNEWDTVGYSSIGEHNAQIVIKRIFRTVSGQTVLPCEIKINMENNLSLSQNLLYSASVIYLESH